MNLNYLHREIPQLSGGFLNEGKVKVKSNSEFDLLLDRFPDRSELMKLLYRLADSAKGNVDIFSLLSRELDSPTDYLDQESMNFSARMMASESPPPAELSPSFEPYRSNVFDRIESLVEVSTTYPEIADLYEEYGEGVGIRSYDELLTYCAHCLEQGDTENEDQIHQEVNRLLSRTIRHPLGVLMRNAFNEETSMAPVYKNLLESYMELVRRKDRNA